MLLDEHETEKDAHQRLLRKYAALEEKRLEAVSRMKPFYEFDETCNGTTLTRRRW